MLENDEKRKQSLGMREKQKVTRGVLDYSLMPIQGLCLFLDYSKCYVMIYPGWNWKFD